MSFATVPVRGGSCVSRCRRCPLRRARGFPLPRGLRGEAGAANRGAPSDRQSPQWRRSARTREVSSFLRLLVKVKYRRTAKYSNTKSTRCGPSRDQLRREKIELSAPGEGTGSGGNLGGGVGER